MNSLLGSKWLIGEVGSTCCILEGVETKLVDLKKNSQTNKKVRVDRIEINSPRNKPFRFILFFFLCFYKNEKIYFSLNTSQKNSYILL